MTTRDLTQNPITRRERESYAPYGAHSCKNCDPAKREEGDIITLFRQFWCWLVRESR